MRSSRRVVVLTLAAALAACSTTADSSAPSDDADRDALATALSKGGAALVFTSSSQEVSENECSAAVKAQLKVASGAPLTFTGSVGLDVSGSASDLTFFSDSACTKSTATPFVVGSSGEAVFYFTGSKAGSATISASLLGLVSASQTETVTASGVSASGATIPPETEITDSAGNKWTVSAGVVYENGAAAAYSSGVSLLLYSNGTIYQENSAGDWWSWTGSAWVASTDPRTMSVPDAGADGDSGGDGGVDSGGGMPGNEVPGPSATLLANPVYSLGIGALYTCRQNFYVSASTGSDANDGKAATTGGGHGPWATIQHADSASRTGGDCINVAPGTYTTSGVALTHGGTGASSDGYVAYRCESLDACHVLYNGTSSGVVWEFHASNYVVVDGFEVDGNGNDAVYGSSYGGIPSSCFFSQQEPQWGHVTSHHVWMLNNKIHDCNLGGIGFQSTEYIFALHNEVYNNAWTSGYEGSGIGLVIMQPLGAAAMGETFSPNPYPAYTPTSQDEGFAPFHIITAWNILHDNGEATTLGASVALSTTGATHATDVLDGLKSVAGLAQSQLVVGPGIAPFTYVKSISGASVTLSREATTSASGGTYQFLDVAINHTDGNGIIYDTWAGTADGCQSGCSDFTYPDQSLIFGNASYHNGGRGIHVFASSNVTVANNSVYANGVDINRQPGSTPSDLSQAGGKNNAWVNNVAVSVLTQANTNSSCNYVVNGTTYSCGGQNMPLLAGDGRGVADTNNTYLHNVLYGGIGVNLWNDDAGYFSTADNLVGRVFGGYPYNTTPTFSGTDKASAVYAAPGDGNLALQVGSPAAGYGEAERYVPSWLKNAGAY